MFFEIKFLKQIVRAVAATRADDGAHLIAHEHFFQLARTALDRTGEVEILLKN